jgi:hypothetical protein
MKPNIPKLFLIILTILLAGCTTNELEVKKYSEMKLENDVLIKLANSAITYQKVRADSLNNVLMAYLEVNIYTDNLLKINKAIDNANEAHFNLEMLLIELGTVDLCCSIIEKANTRFGYLFKNKRSIIEMWTIRLSDTISNIEELTEGLSTEEYIKMYLPSGGLEK